MNRTKEKAVKRTTHEERLTIRLSAIQSEKIGVLVEAGLYDTKVDFVRRAIESLTAQQHRNWTCVIAKNGGDERLAEYRRSLGGLLDLPNVDLLVLPRKGLGYALNEAATRYLGFHGAFAVLEDDDEWDPNFLPMMHQALKANGAHVVHCLQRQVPNQKQSNGGPMDADSMRTHNWINFPMCLYRADLYFEAGGFSEEVGPATDWDWHLRCLKAGAKYHLVPETLVTHHWHGGNYCTKENGRPAIMEQMRQGAYQS